MRRLILAAALTALTACGSDGGGPSGPSTNTNGTVRGVVNDNTGAPVASASVALTGTGQAARSTTTGNDGTYTFATVPAGAYTVAVTPPAGFTLSGGGTSAITVTAGQQTSVGTFVLNRTTTGGPPAIADVSMINTSFSPQQVEVAIGGTLRFTNNDPVQHNATGAGGTIATGNMNQGQVRTQVMASAGTFNYSCTLHPGMSGTVTVR
jgi:plastocyanin